MRKQSIHFNFDGKWSYDMGVMQASVNSGLFDDIIISSKTIIEEKIEGRERPYFFGVERSPLSFTVSVLFEENMSHDKIREVLRWLDSDTYKPLRMRDSPERIWYAMIVSDVSAIHNGIDSGYMELEFRTQDTSTLTPRTFSQNHRIRGNSTVQIENNGDFDCNPIVHIVKHGDGNVSIQNMSNDTGEFKFTGLKDKEAVSVDCETKEIDSSTELFRYDDFSKNYIVLKRGINTIRVGGNFDLMFETEFKVY